jgi:circadian clock protein KaiC
MVHVGPFFQAKTANHTLIPQQEYMVWGFAASRWQPIPRDRVMTRTTNNRRSAPQTLPKCPTGITGLDEVTEGGLPRGRPTLVCGNAGCGKTLLALEFLVRGATQFGEPGVFVAFEESEEELTQNVRSLGFHLDELTEQKKILLDQVRIEPSEIEETGEFDLEGLFVRLGYALDTINARRVVLDTIETLFGGLSNEAILRAELRRLFRWLKDRGVTAVITGERGEGQLTRQGLEEYVSDCVILLDHRVTDQISTRRLRVVKYRGTTHGTNEYPFVIDEQGISVLPVTSLGLGHVVSDERVSTGAPRLDAMLGGGGYFRGSTVLISGTAGVGKTSLAAHFADAVCRRGERCLYLAFEESEGQFVRNMRSIGLDFGPWLKKGLLHFHASRPTASGLELHLLTIRKLVDELEPAAVVIDPISSFLAAGMADDAGRMLLRLVDLLKGKGLTALLTSLTRGGAALEHTEVGLSSLVDSWILLRDIELAGERNRGLYVLKSRGMAHSNQIREFVFTEHGIELLDVYVGPEGVLTGSARVSQEAREQAAALARGQEIERRERELNQRRKVLEAQIVALQAELEAATEETRLILAQEMASNEVRTQDRGRMRTRRGGTADNSPVGPASRRSIGTVRGERK